MNLKNQIKVAKRVEIKNYYWLHTIDFVIFRLPAFLQNPHLLLLSIFLPFNQDRKQIYQKIIRLSLCSIAVVNSIADIHCMIHIIGSWTIKCFVVWAISMKMFTLAENYFLIISSLVERINPKFCMLPGTV